jgi:hypothetical protein
MVHIDPQLSRKVQGAELVLALDAVNCKTIASLVENYHVRKEPNVQYSYCPVNQMRRMLRLLDQDASNRSGVRVTSRQMREEFRLGEYKYKPIRQPGEGFSPLLLPFLYIGSVVFLLGE